MQGGNGCRCLHGQNISTYGCGERTYDIEVLGNPCGEIHQTAHTEVKNFLKPLLDRQQCLPQLQLLVPEVDSSC